MVADYPVHDDRGLCHQIRIELGAAERGLGTSQRGLQAAKISNPVFSPCFFDEAVVQEQNLLGREVAHCLASASKAGR